MPSFFVLGAGAASVVFAATLAIARAPATAADDYWEPNDVYATAVSRERMLALYESTRGVTVPAPNGRIETYRIVAGTATIEARAEILGDDYDVSATLDGARYEMGRNSGRRWRRTASGVTRLISADVQGDDLDRWPLAVIGVPLDTCKAGGETHSAPTLWVLECRSGDGAARWLYVDSTDGHVVRERFREGSRVSTFTFDDLRSDDTGARRPFRWHIDGAGGDADVTVESVTRATLTARDVEIPQSVTSVFRSTTASDRLDWKAGDSRIILDGTIGGKSATILIDSGTSQVIVDGAFVERLGLPQTLGHAILPTVQIGRSVATDLAVQTLDLRRDGYPFDAIVGNEFFSGHIVHVDARHRALDVVAHDAFAAPPKTLTLDLNVDEGIPLVAGRIGAAGGARFALDTGSSTPVALRYLIDQTETGERALDSQNIGRTYPEVYLEGTIFTHAAAFDTIVLGPLRFVGQAGEVEAIGVGDAVEFPIDGIFGTQLLWRCEWWFDYDHDRAWARPY